MTFTGFVFKSGTGTLSLTGTNTYTGGTTVTDGLLTVNGTIGDVSLTGGTLGGSGAVGAVSLSSGGTVAPGNSIGTLTTGDVTFGSGSTYEVEVDSSGNSDKIVSPGTVTIDSGATLSIIAENGTDDGSSYNSSTDYTILTAATLTGSFDTVSENFAYLDASVDYTGTEASLTLTRTQTSSGGGGGSPEDEEDEDDGSGSPEDEDEDDSEDDDSQDITFASAVSTPNQKNTANAVESLGSGNELYDAAEALPEGEPVTAFQKLSGEAHSTLQTFFAASSGILRTTLKQRLINAFGATSDGGQVSMAFNGEGEVPLFQQINAQAWGQTYGGWGKVEATSSTAEVTSYGGGFLLGADAEILRGVRTGLAIGYGRTLFSSSANSSSGTTDSYHFGAYAGTSWDLSGGVLRLHTGASYTLHDVGTDRTVSFTGFSDTVSADYTASTAQAFAELGYMLPLSVGTSLEPFAGLAVVNQHTDGFTETGGSAALTASSSDNRMGVTTLGLRGKALVSENEGLRASVLGRLAWRHAFGDVNPSSTMRFASGGDSFAVSGTPIDKDTALFEAGVSFEKDAMLDINVIYKGELGATAQDHTGRLTLRYSF